MCEPQYQHQLGIWNLVIYTLDWLLLTEDLVSLFLLFIVFLPFIVCAGLCS
jgi:hypothetical protein